MSKSRQSEQYKSFEDLTDRLLGVPRATIQERLAKHRARAAQNPNKRGPKPKQKAIKPSASGREEG